VFGRALSAFKSGDNPFSKFAIDCACETGILRRQIPNCFRLPLQPLLPRVNVQWDNAAPMALKDR
jgi:hypothetical protein